MQQIQCALCGRGFLADENGAGTCPSCGFVAAPTMPAPADALSAGSLSAPAPSPSAAPSPSSSILPPPGPVPPIALADVPASSAPAPQVALPAEPPVMPQPAVEASQPDAIEPPTYVLPIAPGEPVESTPPPSPAPSSSLLPPPAPAPASVGPQPAPAADTIGEITSSQPATTPALSPAVPTAPFPPLADPPQSAYAPPGAYVGPSAMPPVMPPVMPPMMPPAMPPAAPPRPWPIDPRTQAVPPGAYPSGAYPSNAYPYGPGAYQYGQPPTAPYPMASPYSPYSPYSLPMPPGPSVPPAPARRSQAPWLVIGAIAAVLLLLAVTLLGLLDVRGALPFSLHASQTAPATPTASPTASPTATPSAPVGFTAYKDAGGLYSFAYPSGWSKFDGSSAGVPTPTVASGSFGVAIFADGATGASFGIEYLQLSYPGGAQSFDDDIFKSFAQDSTVTNRTGPTTVSIAGESWTQEAADVAASGGSQHLVVEAVSHNDYTVGIFYGAPKAIYAAVESGSFQTMISTFRFLK